MSKSLFLGTMWLVYCIGLKHVYITLTRSHLMTSNNPGEGSGGAHIFHSLREVGRTV